MIWDAILNPIGKVLDRVIPDVNERAKVRAELERQAAQGELDLLLGQLKINLQEAAHKSVFVAGWRPFIGWTCGLILAFNYIAVPLLNFGLELAYPTDTPTVGALDAGTMMPVLLGLLGLAGARSFEKAKGVSREK